MTTYPLLLKPVIKDYIWGGTRLKTEFGYEGGDIAAEAWVLSCHKDGRSVIQNGELKGKTLNDAVSLWGNSSIGERAAGFSYFPILIKLIDARDRLSVQVHPDNRYALKAEGEYGKTEMWYVVDCEPGAQLIYGMNKTINEDEFRAHIEGETLSEVCNHVQVKKGDVFFIDAGTLHAIGAGILIAEVQQNSNTTYRVSDYGRIGANGKPRELHIDKAVDVTVTAPPSRPYGNVGEIRAIRGGVIRQLADCEFFHTDLLTVSDIMEVGKADSFCSLVCIDGECTLNSKGFEPLQLKKGSSLFLPSGIKAQLSGNTELPAQLLYSYI
ncbi:MAG: class I mannose-6-phosphate isomerase [Oscillospiraceae bacterium]|nr:class I mannose-6-phosphate isomerase [Oscillospiraceae bacterium]MDD4413505.1 class I mannose-6-phosphate isomerase [Oscillospiraceae bacterium]